MNNQNDNGLLPFNIGELVSAVHFDCNDFDTADYIPSVQFRQDLHDKLGCAVSNLNSILSIYNQWKQGQLSCNWSAVSELTLRTQVVSGQFKTISQMCRNDRNGMVYNPLLNDGIPDLSKGLTPLECSELKALLDGLHPIELLQLLRHQKGSLV